MIGRISAFVFFVLASVSSADAAYYLYWPDGSVTCVPDEMLLLGALIGLAACFWLVDSWIERASSSSSIPKEVREPQSVEYYQDMTERTHALKRKLDADTELAESYIKAARARAERDDLDNDAHRRAIGRR